MTAIQPMTQEELRTLIAWAGNEGWNPGLNDVECFWRLDPDGFLSLTQDGQLVGGGAVIRHSDAFGFMGLFIVDGPYRGRKLGTQLWLGRRDRLLSRLADGSTIGLDGVDAMVPFYEKGGFRQFTRHRRFQLNTTSGESRRSAYIHDLAAVDPAIVADFDGRCFPARREDFLTRWINQPGAVSLGLLTDGQLRGFGVMRPCLVGWKIGPLFADSDDIADDLWQAFLGERRDEPVFLDAPDNNPAAIELCRRYEMEEVFGCVRMYHGTPPDLAHHRIFGITTLETG